jgi:serine protease Do
MLVMNVMRNVGLAAAISLFATGGMAQQNQARPVQVQHIGQLENLLNASSSFLGVNVSEVDAESAQKLKLKDVHGVEIVSVEENSPAAKAGLMKGDVVLDYQGQRVEGTQQFVRFVRETPTGRQVKMTILREGKDQNISAVIGTRKTTPEVIARAMPQMALPDLPKMTTLLRSGVLGIEAESLDGQLAAYFGVKQGVLVRSVMKDSAAEKAGIKAGDVITKVAGEEVETPRALTAALQSARAKGEAAVSFTRDRKESSVTVKLEQGSGSSQKPRGTNRAQSESDDDL